jgi:ubiquinone/menaquinone biosynthesis C-methylase UbiE
MEVVPICNLCQSDRIQAVDAAYNFCQCGACGFIFDSPRPTADEVASFYSRPAKYDSWLEAEQARDALWQRRLKKLLPHKAPGNLLDIGAGIGQFLHHAKPFFTCVSGTEVSGSAIQIAQQKYGIVLHAGQVEDLELTPESFDNITLFHVLEHVPDPAKLMRRCHTLLRGNGVLFVAVPNDVLAWTSKAKRLGKKLGIGAFAKFSPVLGISRAGASREIHLSHFTQPVLRQLLENAGMTVSDESMDPFYASAGLRLAFDAVYYTAHKFLRAVLKVNRYDTIWMVARKP